MRRCASSSACGRRPRLCDRDVGGQVDVLDGVEQRHAFLERPLEGLAAGDESHPAGPLVDHGRLHGFLEVTVAGTKVTLHLDTGAAASDLTAAFARRAPATVAALGDRAVLGRSRASAGGAVVSEAVSLKQVPLSLAGQSICLPSIDVGLADDETGPTRLGSIGQDALSLFESYSIDFVSMNFEAVGAPKQVADCRSSLTEPEGGADEQAHRLEQ